MNEAEARAGVTMLLADGPCLVRDDPDSRAEVCPLLADRLLAANIRLEAEIVALRRELADLVVE